MILVTEESAVRFKIISLAVGIVGLAGCIVGWIFARRDFFIGYLFAEIFFVGLSLGSLALLMIHHLTGGYWGYGVRRFLEAAVGNLPFLALFFIPILFGLPELYPWEHPEVIAANEALQKTHLYLNAPSFIARAAIVFAVWIILSRLLLKWSADQDLDASVEPTRKMRTLSGPGLVLYPLTMTFASVDWIMSTETQWFSTMFPVLICIGQILGALSLSILLFTAAADSPQFASVAGEDSFHKIGNLLLAFVMMWAYLAFGQFLIIWSGNLPREISWYLHRIAGGWRWILIFFALFQFFVPFFLLLMRPLKKKRHLLAMIAGCVLVSHIVAIWWTIAPSFYQSGSYFSWVALFAFVGIGGLWFAAFIWNFGKRRMIPLNDPRFALAVPV